MAKKLTVEYTAKDIMDKLNSMHTDIQAVNTKVAVTNSKVKLHEKLLWAIGGAMVLIISWIIYIVEAKGGV